jgi:hypothetical protein
MEIRRKSLLLAILIAAALSPMPNSTALSDSRAPLAGSSFSGDLPSGYPLNGRVFRQLALGNQVFKFQNTECVFRSTLGCTVTSSSNPSFSPGYIFSAKVTPIASIGIEPGMKYIRCSWCSFVGESIAIVLFVASAPATTPMWLLIGTYALGTGIFLNHL